MRDLSFLQLKDTDSPELRAMKSYWQMVIDMPEPERKVFLQAERIKDEERYLQCMINNNYADDDFVKHLVHAAKDNVWWHEQTGDDSLLDAAERCMELARSVRGAKFTIADIRKQRERVQWERKKLKTMQPSVEPSQSSEVSKT